jgi:hypothetical protein
MIRRISQTATRNPITIFEVVVFIADDNSGFDRIHLFRAVVAEVHDDHNVAGTEQTGRRTKDADLLASGRRRNDICFDSFAIGDIGQQDFLIGPNTRRGEYL